MVRRRKLRPIISAINANAAKSYPLDLVLVQSAIHPIVRPAQESCACGRVAETMFSKIFGERNSTKTSKYYF
jgi:hypothetical protein